jgi:hypothetical protein
MSLKRLVIEFRGSEVAVRVLYSASLDGPKPATKGRRREVTELTRDGLQDALEALDSEAGVEVVGTSGFTQREDVLWRTR